MLLGAHGSAAPGADSRIEQVQRLTRHLLEPEHDEQSSSDSMPGIGAFPPVSGKEKGCPGWGFHARRARASLRPGAEFFSFNPVGPFGTLRAQ